MIAALAALGVRRLSLASAVAWLHAAGWIWASTLHAVALIDMIIALLSLWLMRRSLLRIGIDNTHQALRMGSQDDTE